MRGVSERFVCVHFDCVWCMLLCSSCVGALLGVAGGLLVACCVRLFVVHSAYACALWNCEISEAASVCVLFEELGCCRQQGLSRSVAMAR